MQEPLSSSYPVLPLRDIVVFPHMIVPLFVGREKSVRALEEVMQDDKQILLSSQIDPGQDDPDTDGIYQTGVLANVLQLLKHELLLLCGSRHHVGLLLQLCHLLQSLDLIEIEVVHVEHWVVLHCCSIALIVVVVVHGSHHIAHVRNVGTATNSASHHSRHDSHGIGSGVSS